jgi:hypothetical protein
VADYEFSTGYVQAIVKALQRLPQARDIEAQLKYEARDLWNNPWGSTWFPAQPFEDLGIAAVAVLGEDAFDALTFGAMKERMGPILLPMLKSTVATKSPGNVFKKLHDLVKVALKGVELTWSPEGPEAGVLQIAYPRPVAPHVLKSWTGVVRFVFEITSPGQIMQLQQLGEGATLQVVVKWTAPATS